MTEGERRAALKQPKAVARKALRQPKTVARKGKV